MEEWDNHSKYAVLDDYGFRRMKVKVVRGISLPATGWFPHYFVKIKGTDQDWRRTQTVKGVDPAWNEEFELDVDAGVIDLEIWENPPWNESGWWSKILRTTETTEEYTRQEKIARLHVSLVDISPPFPEKGTPHQQTFFLEQPSVRHRNEDIDLTHARLVLEFTPINFGAQPSIVIRKFLDTKHLLIHHGDSLMKGFGPKMDAIDLAPLIQGISVMSDPSMDVESKAQIHVRVADVEFFYYYFNYYDHMYYFKIHLRMAPTSVLRQREGALDRHQVTSLVSFHVQYLVVAFTYLLGMTSVALRTLIEKKEGIHPAFKALYNLMIQGGVTHKDVEPRSEGEEEDGSWGLIPTLYQNLFLDNEDTSEGRTLEQEYMQWFFAPTDSERLRFASDMQHRCRALVTKVEEKSHKALERLLDSVDFLG